MPSRFRVPVGWLVGVLVVVLARPSLTSIALGIPLLVAGEALRVWASGHIEKTKVLATGGPYAHCRHPLYVGSLLMALGAAVASASIWVVLAVAVYFLAFFPSVMREETDFIAKKFPQEHAAWAAEVPAFWPRLTPGGSRSSHFDWARVSMNREWRTVVALPLIAVLLYARTLLGF
jgi:protein-S-isoprenylcysteine O-methyltransferase Ste14